MPDNNEICPNCNRPILDHSTRLKGNKCDASYSYVVHAFYGCDTGCEGHRAFLCDENGNELAHRFDFDCPSDLDERDKWATDFCKQYWPHVPVKLEECRVVSF